MPQTSTSGRKWRQTVLPPPPPPPPPFRPERITLLLLLLALSTLFLCSFDKGYFYRFYPPGRDTPKNMAIAENLSPDHHFRLFVGRRQGSGDAPAYEMYSRFPVGGYALIKLAILPFGNDLSARILAARMLMLLLFSAAALLAFHSLARVTSHRWIALAATLPAFSSYYMLFYGDAVSVEASLELFAVTLVFHGMVVFVQEGRFRQLLARTCVALLLGWRVYAFLLPFLILGLAHEAVRAWKDGTAVWPRVRSTGAAVLRSRYTALGLFALLFGAAVLGFNFANEYAAFGGETRVVELPSVHSMLGRTGLAQYLDASFDHGWWMRFLRQQFFRVFVASVPSVLTDWEGRVAGVVSPGSLFVVPPFGPELSFYLLALLMVAVASTTVVRLARRLLDRRHRMLVATLALSGFFWALPMHNNTADPNHTHEAMFYVGVPLVSYSLLLLYLHKRWGRGPVVGFAVVALLAFVVSAFQMDRRWGPDVHAAELQQATMAEFGTIRETTRGKVVLVLGSVEPEWSWQAMHPDYVSRYYLAGSILAKPLHTEELWGNYPVESVLAHFQDTEAAARAADFLVTRDRVESDALLTPGNERVFLYDSAGTDDLMEFYRTTYQRVVSGEPAARSHFDVYLGDRALFHVREPCVREDVGNEIFVEVVPEDPKALPGRDRQRGFRRVIPFFQYRGVLFEGKCMAILPLPDYPVSGIRTGQQRPIPRPRRRGGRLRQEGHRGWEVRIRAGLARSVRVERVR